MKSLSALLLLGWVCVVTHVGQALPRPAQCGQPADVVFVVDASSSVWGEDFSRRVLPFIADVVSKFPVGPGPSHTRIGLLTFASKVTPQFGLEEGTDKDQVLRKILSIQQTGGDTHTAEALAYVTDVLMRGARRDVEHVVVVLTDGASTDGPATRLQAARARQAGSRLLAVGVGQADDLELSAIASDPDSLHKFKVTDFDALKTVTEQLALSACPVTQPPTTTTTTVPPTTTTTTTSTTSTTAAEEPAPLGMLGDQPLKVEACGGKPAEVYFLLDSSSSIWEKEFQQLMLPFIRDVASAFDLGPQRTRLALTTFSDFPQPVLALGDVSDRAALPQALSPERVRYLGGGTDTALALRWLRERGLAQARPHVERVAILVTDGNSHHPEATRLEAERLREAGVRLLAVGVGPAVDKRELRAVASLPHEQHVFSVSGLGALASLRELLALRTCVVGEGPDAPRPLQDPGHQGGAPGCLANADVMFAYDALSLGLDSSRTVNDVMGKVTAYFRGEKGVQLGLVSSHCLPQASTVELTGARAFSQRLSSNSASLTSRLQPVLKHVRHVAFPAKSRGERTRVAVVFADAASLGDGEGVALELARHGALGVRVVLVTLGHVDEAVLHKVTSRLDGKDVISVGDSVMADTLPEELHFTLCNHQ